MRFVFLLVLFLSHSLPLFAQVEWVPTLGEAKKLAAAGDKFIVIDVSADWCPPCIRMARDVHPDPQFIEFTQKNVFMLVDAYKNKEGVRLAERYDVSLFPTILVLDQTGKEIDRLTGGNSTKGLIEDLGVIFADPITVDALNKKAVQAPNELEIQILAGKRANQRDDSKRATRFLSRALELVEKDNLELRVELLMIHARAAFESSQYTACLDSLNQLAQVYPEASSVTELQFMKARALHLLKQYDESYQIMHDLLRTDQRSKAQQYLTKFPKKYRRGDKEFEKLLTRADKDFRKDKLPEALDLAQQAEEMRPASPQAHHLLALVHFRSSSLAVDPAEKSRLLSQALKELRTARRLDPSDMTTYATAKEVLAAGVVADEPTDPKVRKKYHKAEDHFAAERYRDAAELYLEIIDLEPAFGKAYLHLGDCFFGNGQYGQALQLYQNAIKVNPRDPSAYRFAADTLMRLKRLDESRSALISSVLADPEYPVVWSTLDDQARLEGSGFERHYDAVPTELLLADDGDYEDLLETVPPETSAAWREYLNRKILWKSEKFAQHVPGQPYFHSYLEEEESLTQLLEKWNELKRQDPSLKDPNLDYLRQVYLDGRLPAFIFLELFCEEYRAEFEQWKPQNRAAVEAYFEDYLFGSARATLDRGENSSAIKAYNAGVAVHRSNPEEAKQHYRKALEHDPEMLSAINNLSLIYHSLELEREAEALLLRWIDLQPSSPSPFDRLSMIYAGREDFTKAAEMVEKALELETDPEQRDRLQRNLEIFQSNDMRRPD